MTTERDAKIKRLLELFNSLDDIELLLSSFSDDCGDERTTCKCCGGESTLKPEWHIEHKQDCVAMEIQRLIEELARDQN
jgi:hypothetical protein